MNILYISRTLPSDYEDGAKQRTSLIFNSLKKIGEVYTLIPVWDKTLAFVDKDKKLQYVNVRLESRVGNFFYKVLHKTIWKWMPLLTQSFFTKSIKEKIFPGINFNVIVVRYTENALLFKPWTIAPTIIDIDDHPLELLEKSVCKHSMYYWFYRFFLMKLLKSTYKKCASVWVSNADHVCSLQMLTEVNYISNICLPPPINYLPFGRQEKILLTVGNLGYSPNYLGINKFLDEYWPFFYNEDSDWKWYIVGAHIRDEDYNKWSQIPNIILTGYMADLKDLYEKCMYVVTPVYSGSGTCIKVIEGLTYSRICIGPGFAFRGIPPQQQSLETGILNYDGLSHETLVKRLLHLTDSERHDIQDRAAHFAREHFSMESVEHNICEALKRVSLKYDRNPNML